MDELDLVSVGSFTESKALVVASRLSARGIRAYVIAGTGASSDGETHPSTSPAERSPHVEVRVPAQLEVEAREAMTDDDQETAALRCSRCGAGIDPGFHVCWSCGAELAPDVSAMSLEVLRDGAAESGGCCGGGCSSGTPKLTAAQEAALEEAFAANDLLAKRALTAAKFSLVCPPLLIVSLLIVARASLRPMSPRGNRRFLLTWLLIVVESCLFFYVGKLIFAEV